jgi:two-component system, response regulator PdtaR
MPETDNSKATFRVLVLEDEFIIADEIASILEDAGHTVLGPAPTIDGAMARLEDEAKPDAAIIDANIRGDSSVVVARRLRELQVPFCLCTGYRSGDMAGEFGDVAIIQKPVNPADLLATIQSLAGNAKD